MMHIRGHPSDYDRWAKVTNDERWKYENLVPYFVRSENFCEKCVNSTQIPQQNNDCTCHCVISIKSQYRPNLIFSQQVYL